MTLGQRIKYLVSSGWQFAIGANRACPSCGSLEKEELDAKYIVTRLGRCSSCQLLFRYPTTPEDGSNKFYQNEYEQGFTTELPNNQEIEHWKAQGFPQERNYGPYIRVLEALGAKAGDRLLDFGCSWGFGSWQLAAHGFDVQAFEVSRPRGRFARDKLGIDVIGSLNEARQPVDIFFSAHVLEHVPSVNKAIAHALTLLRPGGLFVAFTPNGADAFKLKAPYNWHASWGLVHPQLLDDRFYSARFAGFDVLMASNPYDRGAIEQWALNRGQARLDLSGGELLCVARTPVTG
jgi:SAM-dependent methyltransferase